VDQPFANNNLAVLQTALRGRRLCVSQQGTVTDHGSVAAREIPNRTRSALPHRVTTTVFARQWFPVVAHGMVLE
jgi:hypothetical protein